MGWDKRRSQTPSDPIYYVHVKKPCVHLDVVIRCLALQSPPFYIFKWFYKNVRFTFSQKELSFNLTVLIGVSLKPYSSCLTFRILNASLSIPITG